MTPISGDDPSTRVASFAAGLSFDDVPDEAASLIERAFVDTVGVTLAGSATDAARRVRSAFGADGGETTVVGSDEPRPLSDAVFANATAGHCLDFDDVALPVMDGHPSVPMVAPLLAVGEARNATGRDLVTAFAAGFEAQHFLSRPISPTHYEDGWHATSTIGTFGAAVAVSNLLGLDADEIAHALNAAASLPAGLKRNFGSMTKPIHVGQAARSGTTAATLAAEGVTADPNAIAGDRGFFDLYSSAEPDPARSPELGSTWALRTRGIDVKKYPCCYYTHAAIYAAAELAAEHELSPADVEAVRVRASPGAADALHHVDPSTGLEAKFSMEYVVARAIVDGHPGLRAFDDDRIDDPAVQRVRERVSVSVDPDVEYDSNAATVTIETSSGETHERQQERPPGTHAEPLSDDELAEKFRMCARRVDGFDEVEATLDALADLREVDDVATLVSTLSA